MRDRGGIFDNQAMKSDSSFFAGAPTHQAVSALSLQQLLGKHARFERELANAFSAQPWPAALIERLTDELQATESEIEALQGA